MKNKWPQLESVHLTDSVSGVGAEVPSGLLLWRVDGSPSRERVKLSKVLYQRPCFLCGSTYRSGMNLDDICETASGYVLLACAVKGPATRVTRHDRPFTIGVALKVGRPDESSWPRSCRHRGAHSQPSIPKPK